MYGPIVNYKRLHGAILHSFKLEIVIAIANEAVKEYKLYVTVFSTKTLKASPLHDLKLESLP